MAKLILSNFLIIITLCLLSVFSNAEVVQLNSGNMNEILLRNEFVFVNFYADWCRFSQILAPVFEEAQQKVQEEFSEEGHVVFGRVDCDREGGIAAQYAVSKYPTIKMFRYGTMVKREYRGQRSAEAISSFVRQQMENPVTRVNDLSVLENIDSKKPGIVGYFDTEDSHDYKFIFRKVASMLRDDCVFYSVSGALAEETRVDGANRVMFRPVSSNFGHNGSPESVMYTGSTSDYSALYKWTLESCVPLVREITFENAEELTEEGLPFLILFHRPDDISTPEIFRNVVSSELAAEKSIVNFLTADGLKFTHPLHHLGKSPDDLPILAIDSFHHMYVWTHNPRTDMNTPGLLKTFIQDLQSGKLHREFHQGPDPTPAQIAHSESSGHVPKDASEEQPQKPNAATSPPESLFRRLAPSRTRYTILRDEL